MRPTCSEGDCDRKVYARGLCQRHYIVDQYRDTPPPTDEEIARRIWPKVIKTETCWLWTGARHAKYGHGMFGYNAMGRNVTRYVHRWVYEQLVGPIPEGLVLDHVRERGCTNTNCCNPAHLEPVSNGTNTLRGVGPTADRARQTHCKRGHPLSGENLYVHPKRGHRHCRECSRLRSAGLL